MLKVLVFYIVLWWFTKLENKKALTVRATLASIFAIFFLMGAIIMFTSTNISLSVVFGICFLIITMLFGLRVVFDIKKILVITKGERNG